MDKLPCPGCTTPLDADVTCCPICTRPRSKQEIARAYLRFNKERLRKKSRPLIILLFLLSIAGAFWMERHYHHPARSALLNLRARSLKFMDEAVDPNNLLKTPQTPPPPAVSPPVPLPTPPAPSISHSAEVVSEPPLPVINSEQYWILTGRIYNLRTLKPCPNARLEVKSGDSSSGTIVADGNGRYYITLQRLPSGSYTLSNLDSAFAATALYESDIPYAQLSASDRTNMIISANTGDLVESSLSDVPREPVQRRDIFLAPKH